MRRRSLLEMVEEESGRPVREDRAAPISLEDANELEDIGGVEAERESEGQKLTRSLRSVGPFIR